MGTEVFIFLEIAIFTSSTDYFFGDFELVAFERESNCSEPAFLLIYGLKTPLKYKKFDLWYDGHFYEYI